MELLKRMKIHTQDGRTYRISLYWRGCAYLVQKDQPWTEWDYPWENNNGWRMIMMLSDPDLEAAIKEYYRMAKNCIKKLHFYITEYEDGNLKIETKHIHYMFRNDLNFDDFEPNRLDEIINIITDVCRKEGITAYFTKN